MDDSGLAQRVLEYTLGNLPDAEVTVSHAVGEPSPRMGADTGLALGDDLDEAAEERAKVVFDRAWELAAEHDVEITTDVQRGSQIGRF